MSLSPSLNHLIIRFYEQVSARVRLWLLVVGCWLLVVGCWLLVVALYGGAIEPNSGTVRLRSLVMLLEPLGINEKLIRSSVFRLAKQGWLTSKK
jgi:phenylacetic acid degradation operon negative regulatory protein